MVGIWQRRRHCPFGQGFDFTNPDILENGIPVAEFAELRKTAPVWWNEQPGVDIR